MAESNYLDANKVNVSETGVRVKREAMEKIVLRRIVRESNEALMRSSSEDMNIEQSEEISPPGVYFIDLICHLAK